MRDEIIIQFYLQNMALSNLIDDLQWLSGLARAPERAEYLLQSARRTTDSIYLLF